MVIFGLLLTLLFGWSLLNLLRLQSRGLSTFALSYLLGIGIQSLLMFFLALLHIKLTAVSVSLVTIAAAVVAVVLNYVLNKKVPHFPDFRESFRIYLKTVSQMDNLERVLLLGVGGVSVYALIIGFYWPVTGWDALALYDFRAKVFADTGFMDDAIARGYFLGYPLFTSMAHTWYYLLGWGYPQFIYSLMYISFGILFYEAVRLFSTRLTSLFFTLLMLTSPTIFSNAAFAYTNLPYMVYYALGTFYLFQWIVKRNMSLLLVSALFMGLSTWVRSTEPFWLVNLGVMVLASYKKRIFLAPLYYALLFFPIQQSWSIFQAALAPHAGTVAQATQTWAAFRGGIDFLRLLMIVDFIRVSTMTILAPHLLLLIAVTILPLKKISEWGYLLLLVYGNILLLILGAYIFTFIWQGWALIGESLGRMAIVYIPLFLYVAAIRVDLEKILQMMKIKNFYLK